MKPRPNGSRWEFSIFTLFLVALRSPALGQAPARPDADSLYNAYMNLSSLVRGGSVQAHWMRDGSSFWYAEGAPDSTVIYKVHPEANTRVVLIDPERLRRALTPLLGHEPPQRGLPFEEFEFLDDEKAVRFTLEEEDFVLRLDTYEVSWSPAVDRSDAIPKQIPTPGLSESAAGRELLFPDGRWLLGFKDHNLLLRSLDGRTVPLTSDGVEDHGWIPPGFEGWAGRSPDGAKVVAAKLDWRGVPKIPLPCFAQGEDVRWVYYPTAGDPWPRKEFFVLDIPDGRRVPIDVGHDTDQYWIDILGWQADGSRVFLLRSHRYTKRTELLAADAATGRARLLFVEQGEVPISPDFMPLADGKRFVRLSPYPGQSDYVATAALYLHDIDGGLIRVLTPDTLPAVSIVAVDEATGWLYWTGRTRDPRADRHLYRVRLDGTGLMRLTEGVGRHEIQLSPSKRFFVDRHSFVDRPHMVELRSVEGTLLQTLSTTDITALEALGWRPPEEFVVKAADGTTDNFGILFKPTDFDPEKRYPVIGYTYAAPMADEAPRRFASPWYVEGQALSQLGFIVVMVDWRGDFGWGTPREPIYGNFGRYEVPDHVAALKQLGAERPYMDLDRAGIYGVSHGGFTAVRAMLQAPDFYKVGVAIAPFTDMSKHMWNNGRLGPVETNREAHENSSNIPLAKNLRGKLLLIHGTCDADIPLSHTMRIIEEFARAGRPYDLILLPGEGHELAGYEAYWMDAVRRYFVEHLKP